MFAVSDYTMLDQNRKVCSNRRITTSDAVNSLLSILISTRSYFLKNNLHAGSHCGPCFQIELQIYNMFIKDAAILSDRLLPVDVLVT